MKRYICIILLFVFQLNYSYSQETIHYSNSPILDSLMKVMNQVPCYYNFDQINDDTKLRCYDLDNINELLSIQQSHSELEYLHVWLDTFLLDKNILVFENLKFLYIESTNSFQVMDINDGLKNLQFISVNTFDSQDSIAPFIYQSSELVGLNYCLKSINGIDDECLSLKNLEQVILHLDSVGQIPGFLFKMDNLYILKIKSKEVKKPLLLRASSKTQCPGLIC